MTEDRFRADLNALVRYRAKQPEIAIGSDGALDGGRLKSRFVATPTTRTAREGETQLSRAAALRRRLDDQTKYGRPRSRYNSLKVNAKRCQLQARFAEVIIPPLTLLVQDPTDVPEQLEKRVSSSD